MNLLSGNETASEEVMDNKDASTCHFRETF